MGEIIQFPKPDPQRDAARLIQEARALYESVFPTEKGPAGVQPNRLSGSVSSANVGGSTAPCSKSCCIDGRCSTGPLATYHPSSAIVCTASQATTRLRPSPFAR